MHWMCIRDGISFGFSLCKCLSSARLIRFHLAPSQKQPCFSVAAPSGVIDAEQTGSTSTRWQAVMWVTCQHIQEKAFPTLTGCRRSWLPQADYRPFLELQVGVWIEFKNEPQHVPLGLHPIFLENKYQTIHPKPRRSFNKNYQCF